MAQTPRALNFAELPLDEKYNLRIVPSDVFLKMGVIDPQRFREIGKDKIKRFICGGCLVSIADEDRVLRADQDKVRMALDIATITEYKIPVFQSEKGITIPRDAEALSTIAGHWAKSAGENYGRPRATPETFARFISLFCSYPSFGPVYDAYVADPDDGVVLGDIDQDQPATMSKKEPTIQDVKLTCHMLLLLMAKNFSSNEVARGNQIQNYTRSRVSAAKIILNSPTAELLIVQEDIPKFMELWNLLPKLKEAIFLWSIQNSDVPEFGAAHLLMVEAQMVILSCMSKFINGQKKTKAHTCPQIWQEVSNFTAAFKAIKDEMGQLWVYYRVLRPRDTTLACVKFPNLARAGFVYCKKYIETSDSFANVVVPNTKCITGLDAMAETEDTGRHFTAQQVTLTAAQEEGARQLGVDIAQWQPAAAADRTLGVGMENLARLLAEMGNQ